MKSRTKRILVALALVLAMAFQALPASADNGTPPVVDPLTITWE